MDRETGRKLGGLLARVTVGAVFVYSGVIKLMAPPEEFAFAIESYQLVGPQLGMLTAQALPWVELYAGVLLLAGVFTRWMSLAALAMLFGFEVILGQAMARGLDIASCGCFGAASGTPPQEFLQNLGLMLLAWVAFKFGGAYSADAHFSQAKPPEAAGAK